MNFSNASRSAAAYMQSVISAAHVTGNDGLYLFPVAERRELCEALDLPFFLID